MVSPWVTESAASPHKSWVVMEMQPEDKPGERTTIRYQELAFDVEIDFDAMSAAGAILGSGGIIVGNEDVRRVYLGDRFRL